MTLVDWPRIPPATEHWIKYNNVKVAANEAYHSFLAAWDAEAEGEEAAPTVAPRKVSSLKLKVERIRRNERRTARDAKCFDPYDKVLHTTPYSLPPSLGPTPRHANRLHGRKPVLRPSAYALR